MITSYVYRKLKTNIPILKPTDFSEGLMLLITIGLLSYSCIVAYVSDITYDEAHTYLMYCKKEAPNFLAIHLANNHPLNSFFIYISSFLFPYNELAIRFPNLLFLLLYLICSIKIAKSYKSGKLFVFGLFSLYFFLVPVFFSQARGYGIATTLILLFLTRFSYRISSDKNIIINFYLLLFATSAFTGLLPFVFAVALYYLIFEIKFNLFHFIKNSIVDILIISVGFSYLLYNLLEVSKAGKPLFGSENDFLSSTIGFYLSSFFEFLPSLNYYQLLVISLIPLLLFIWLFIKNPKSTKISFITILTFSLFYLGSNFSGRPYITGRLLLPLFPLIVFSIIELIHLTISFFNIKKGLIYKGNIILFSLLFVNYIYKSHFKIKLHGNYKEEIFEKFNFDIAHNGCKTCSTIPFYKQKFNLFPPAEDIKKNPSFSHQQLTDGIICYYSSQYPILLFDISDNVNIEDHFFVHITPKNNNDLPEERQQYGFDNLDFSWGESKKFKVIQLPKYEYNTINMGQYNQKGRTWEKMINIK